MERARLGGSYVSRGETLEKNLGGTSQGDRPQSKGTAHHGAAATPTTDAKESGGVDCVGPGDIYGEIIAGKNPQPIPSRINVPPNKVQWRKKHMRKGVV